MNRPRTMLLSAVFVSLVAVPIATSASESRPNFVFILTDDQGWSQSSVAMHPQIADSRCVYFETPNHERLAREGMRFSSGYAPLPAEIDGGSFASLLLTGTGRVKRSVDGVIFHRPFSRVPAGGQSILRSGNFKLILNWGADTMELYDLENDIGERHDLATSMPENNQYLRRVLVDYLAAVGAEKPGEQTIGNPARRRRNR